MKWMALRLPTMYGDCCTPGPDEGGLGNAGDIPGAADGGPLVWNTLVGAELLRLNPLPGRFPGGKRVDDNPLGACVGWPYDPGNVVGYAPCGWGVILCGVESPDLDAWFGSNICPETGGAVYFWPVGGKPPPNPGSVVSPGINSGWADGWLVPNIGTGGVLKEAPGLNPPSQQSILHIHFQIVVCLWYLLHLWYADPC